MKFLAFGLLMAFSISSEARTDVDGTVFYADQASCAEMQQALYTQSMIQVRFGGGLAANFYSAPQDCPISYRAESRFFRARGGEACRLRWACKPETRRFFN